MRRFEPEQSAADDDGVATVIRSAQHRADVVHVAEGDDSLQVVPRHRDDERVGAGREEQLVVGFDAARA